MSSDNAALPSVIDHQAWRWALDELRKHEKDNS